MLQCVAVYYVCWVVLQFAAVRYRAPDLMAGAEIIAVYCGVLQCVVVCCSVLQRAAVCCSVLQCVAVCYSALQSPWSDGRS